MYLEFTLCQAVRKPLDPELMSCEGMENYNCWKERVGFSLRSSYLYLREEHNLEDWPFCGLFRFQVLADQGFVLHNTDW